jgi:hypothetical protein
MGFSFRFFVSVILISTRSKLSIVGNIHWPEAQLVAGPQTIDHKSEFRIDFLLVGAHDLATCSFHKSINALA